MNMSNILYTQARIYAEINFVFVMGTIFSITAALIGSKKGLGVAGFFIGIILVGAGATLAGSYFGSLLGILGVVIVLHMKGDRISCQYCKEYINPAATKCPKCQTDFSMDKSLGKKKCPACAEIIRVEALKCRYCGQQFDAEEVNQQIAAGPSPLLIPVKALEREEKDEAKEINQQIETHTTTKAREKEKEDWREKYRYYTE